MRFALTSLLVGLMSGISAVASAAADREPRPFSDYHDERVFAPYKLGTANVTHVYRRQAPPYRLTAPATKDNVHFTETGSSYSKLKSDELAAFGISDAKAFGQGWKDEKGVVWMGDVLRDADGKPKFMKQEDAEAYCKGIGAEVPTGWTYVEADKKGESDWERLFKSMGGDPEEDYAQGTELLSRNEFNITFRKYDSLGDPYFNPQILSGWDVKNIFGAPAQGCAAVDKAHPGNESGFVGRQGTLIHFGTISPIIGCVVRCVARPKS
ncbi:hypothetical protein K2X33_09580 [bacterium]|nr:hypothetical protein [bacterium]